MTIFVPGASCCAYSRSLLWQPDNQANVETHWRSFTLSKNLGMVAITAVWVLLGPVFGFSDTWQLTMNTAASQVTFLIAFLLQSTQNRDTRALQLKLDELIQATPRHGHS